MYKVGSEQYKNFIKEKFIVCECGYHNSKERNNLYGTCLRCGKIIDKKAYLGRLIWEKNGRKRNGK